MATTGGGQHALPGDNSDAARNQLESMVVTHPDSRWFVRYETPRGPLFLNPEVLRDLAAVPERGASIFRYEKIADTPELPERHIGTTSVQCLTTIDVGSIRLERLEHSDKLFALTFRYDSLVPFHVRILPFCNEGGRSKREMSTYVIDDCKVRVEPAKVVDHDRTASCVTKENGYASSPLPHGCDIPLLTLSYFCCVVLYRLSV